MNELREHHKMSHSRVVTPFTTLMNYIVILYTNKYNDIIYQHCKIAGTDRNCFYNTTNYNHHLGNNGYYIVLQVIRKKKIQSIL